VPTFRLRAGVSNRCLAAVGASLRTENCSSTAANQKWHFDRTNNALQVESNPGASQNRCVEATGHNGEETRMRWCAWWSGGKRFDFRYPTNSWSYVYLSNSTDIGGRGLCIIEANSTTGDTKMDSCEYYTHKVYAPYNPTLEQVASGGVIDITTDQYFATMVYANGEVKTFGLNNGALGNGVYVDTSNFDTYKRQAYNPTPVKFILPPGVKAVSSWTTSNGIDSKNGNTFVVTSDGRVFGAGSNVTGQLGIGHVGGGTNGIYPTPQQMLVLGAQGNLASYVRSGYGTTVVYANNRKVFTVGNNSNGQLGDDTTTTNPTPRANKNTNPQRHVKFY
jgi:ricin-type beta-trefoil lectin domain